MTRTHAAVLLLAVAGTPVAQARPADPHRFDGTWSVEVLTESGTCDRAYRYPVRIDAGRARLVGTAYTVEGRVAAGGSLRGTIANGTSTARIVGRLGVEGFGTGTWVATGAVDCRGRWNAERRG